MKINKIRWTATLACAASVAMAAMAGCGDKKMTDEQKMAIMATKPDIIATATGPGMGDVTTVVSLIKKAGLVETLQGPGPFTVFAPTNEAFSNVPQAMMDKLSANPDMLKAVLLYHVHPGQGLLESDLTPGTLSTADAGQTVEVKKDGDTYMVNDATIIPAHHDVICKNGVIHWIDKVLVPNM